MVIMEHIKGFLSSAGSIYHSALGRFSIQHHKSKKLSTVLSLYSASVFPWITSLLVTHKFFLYRFDINIDFPNDRILQENKTKLIEKNLVEFCENLNI